MHHYIDQDRDELGRWTDEGGGTTTEIVTTHKDAGAAIKAAASDYSKEAALLEAALELNRKALEVQPEFEEKVRLANSFLHGTETGTNLKKVERIADKAKKEYGGNVGEVTDPIRSTLVIETKDRYPAAIEAFKKAGAVKVKLQQGEGFLGYTGVLAKFKMSNGIYAEVQANYPEMLYAKEEPANAKRFLGEKRWNEIAAKTKIEGGLGHKYYEDFRKFEDKRKAGTLTVAEADYIADIKTKSIQYYKNFY